MEKLSKFLEGKKTYISLAVLLIGMFGWTRYITPEEATVIMDSVFKIIGTVGVIYGRANAKPKV